MTSAPSSNAVEDGWYQLLPKPYRRKNAPYDSLEELHMVRGVTDDYWATFVDPDPTNPRKRGLTVWGQGTINVNTANPLTLYAIICSGAPQAELCTDSSGTQMQTFVTGVMMAQGMTMGAPLFGSTADFIATLKGQGMLGPMLSALGMKPVKFSSESDFAKSISTESKVFSIYAVGVVKGYKRETRVRLHAVVDFRAAPTLANLESAVAGATWLPRWGRSRLRPRVPRPMPMPYKRLCSRALAGRFFTSRFSSERLRWVTHADVAGYRYRKLECEGGGGAFRLPQDRARAARHRRCRHERWRCPGRP